MAGKVVELWESSSGRNVAIATAGGGPQYPDMESRVAQLEAHAQHLLRDVGVVQADLRTVREALSESRVDLGVVKTELSHVKSTVDKLPGKGFISGWAVTVLAAIVVTMGSAMWWLMTSGAHLVVSTAH